MPHPTQPLFAASCLALALLAFSPVPARAEEPPGLDAGQRGAAGSLTV